MINLTGSEGSTAQTPAPTATAAPPPRAPTTANLVIPTYTIRANQPYEVIEENEKTSVVLKANLDASYKPVSCVKHASELTLSKRVQSSLIFSSNLCVFMMCVLVVCGWWRNRNFVHMMLGRGETLTEPATETATATCHVTTTLTATLQPPPTTVTAPAKTTTVIDNPSYTFTVMGPGTVTVQGNRIWQLVQ